ncbi:E3 ubiquitin-protein ligase MIB2 isoform X2 [Lingula anatina]|uniref:RING-type E3 ubiquitin transferase n=1 Tax=Lingula anatina TaxID=7574 RepID=A0A1S3II44_LINAN|nr:E3 ubiquitin-protein ligase MIB2 isoform X2 [Lingula anatina]|eukprot:XP_013397887.1 E3 ubiquitin-protein ligase MIB2 isoform X2 [Lingula anatina]
MEVGLRVVRGPDWKWSNQDDGEGHVGTVVEIGRPGSQTSPDKTVVVQWDSGSRTNYRVGYQGAFDLRILDNAPIGVKHPNIICDACKKQGIQGMRWKCAKCYDFDLCSHCYMSDKHDTSHPFMRFDTANSQGVKVPKRSTSVKLTAKGIFSGAKVVRGPDWDWASQDGGEGKVGKVLDIRGWDTESGRSVANVSWTTGSTNVYRLGHKGKVDLKYIQDAPGWPYYRDHLPVLGEHTEASTAAVVPCQFRVGDKVKVDLDLDILKAMQEGHGGWNPKMAEFIGKVGTVHRITERGDVRVQYEGCQNRWTFHAGALTKVQQFSVADIVKISENLHEVRKLQVGHGEWTDSMKAALGKIGKVLKVYADGDLRVAVNKQTWTFNPACCTVLPHGAEDLNNSMASHEREDRTTTLTALLEQLFELQLPDASGPDRLVREAAQGHIDNVKNIVTKFPDKVDQKSAGKTALQVASHQGHIEIVKLLLSSGANLELQDEDGDTALHYASFGNQPEITEYLLSKGANINALNNGGCSTLHVAVNKQHVDCVRVLLRHTCDVNIQDSYGDTALHDGIGKDNQEIIDLLCNYPGIDFTLRNKRGFNVLHHAALKGNKLATERILLKARQVADVKKDDGFSALHLAALNGHKEVAEILLTQGQADIEIRNNRKQTPLLLAVSQGHTALLELLVSKGADVNVQDEDGDTCLHLALMRQNVATELDNSPILAAIRSQLGMTEDDTNTGTAIACYLAQQGASLTNKNAQGKTPLDVITDPKVQEQLKQFAGVQTSTPANPAENSMPSCKVCEDDPADVKFMPCGHQISCSDCCAKMKKCLECGVPIQSKVAAGGTPIKPSSVKRQDSSNDFSESKFQELQAKMQEMEDTVMCSICLDRKKDLVFLCGHSACHICAQPLRNCHMCRKPITKRINLFT